LPQVGKKAVLNSGQMLILPEGGKIPPLTLRRS
jgi:hypothetical protein